jgi:hypothetical protein
VDLHDGGTLTSAVEVKRSDALAPLSRDHHHALVVARSLIRATDKTAAPAARQFEEFLAAHELAHFAIEESLLLPVVPAEDRGRELARRMLDDHAFLRAAVEQPGAPDAASLREIGLRLRDHVQMEERELFPYPEESLSASALEKVGLQIQASVGRRS